MGTNIQQACAEMDLLAKSISDQVQQIEKDLTENIFDILVGMPPHGTPIDTGWASANWIVSINSPIGGSVPDTGNESGARIVSESSLSQLLSSDLSSVNSIFITNRVSYINLLNDGTSTQSPRDFVDTAVQNGRTLLGAKRIR